jgi:tryptophanyl-tRNA synthetase
LAPIRVRFEELMSDPAETTRVLAKGAESASAIAQGTMAEVAGAVGLASPR